MTNKEVSKLVNSNESVDFLKNIEIELVFEKVDVSLNFKGVTSLYSYLKKQKNGWNSLKNELPQKEYGIQI